MATKSKPRTFPLKHVAAEGDTPRTVGLANNLNDDAVAFLNGVPRNHVFVEGDDVSLGAGKNFGEEVSFAYVEQIFAEKKATDDKSLAMIQHNLCTAGLLPGRCVTGDYNDETAVALDRWHVALQRPAEDGVNRLVLFALGRGTFNVVD